MRSGDPLEPVGRGVGEKKTTIEDYKNTLYFPSSNISVVVQSDGTNGLLDVERGKRVTTRKKINHRSSNRYTVGFGVRRLAETK